MITRAEVAGKLIEAFESLSQLFLEIPKRPEEVTEENCREAEKRFQQFSDIYNTLVRKRFELERIRLGKL